MGLTNQQKLYGLPDYYLLLSIGDNEIFGLIDENNCAKINTNDLANIGFYLKKVNFDKLYSEGLNIIKEENLI